MANFLDIIKGEGPAIAFIRSAIETAKSATEILEDLSKSGIGIRRQTGLQVIKYLRDEVVPVRKYIDNLGLSKLPTIDRLPKSITTQLRNFAYHTVMEGFSTLTGEKTTRNITVSSNQLLTKEQALDYAVSIAESENQSGGLDGATGRVTDVFQNSGGLTF